MIWKFRPVLAIYSIDECVVRLLDAICAAELGGGGALGEWVFFEYDASTCRRIAMGRIWAVFRNRRSARRLGAPDGCI